MKHKLQDRTAVISGASKGLGKAMALALAVFPADDGGWTAR